MPKLEYYTTLDGRRAFESKADYLDYLRVRRRHRLSQRRLDERRRIAAERLADFRNCISVEDMQTFLNDHLADLEILDNDFSKHQYTRVVLILSPGMVFDREHRTGFTIPGWKGQFQYEYITREKRRPQWSEFELQDRYDIRTKRSRRTVMDILGMESRGGSGMSPYGDRKTGHMCYGVHISSVDFPGMAMFDRLAA